MASSPSSDAQRDPIRIGLTLSGAATGGCYEAGVLDFFIEAMMCLQKYRETQPHDHDDPQSHQFPIEVDKIAGTSAGGITALLACVSFSMPEYTPLPNHYKYGDPAPVNNPLFRTWVKETNVERLFDVQDLLPSESKKDVQVTSILSSLFVDTVTHLVVDPRKHKQMPPWADNLELILTNTSLRGTPYSVGPWRSVITEQEKYRMRNCSDFVSFRVTTDPDSIPPELKRASHVFDVRSELYSKEWQHAISSVKATSAFPVGFPTANVKTPVTHYDIRSENKPDWEMNVLDDPKYNEYAAVDGGIMNNDPFVIVEDLLARSKREDILTGRSANGCGDEAGGGGGEHAKSGTGGGASAVILVTPFPDDAADNGATQGNMPLIQMVITLARALYTGMRFKTDAIEESGGVPKHFLSPFEGTPGVDARARELACSTLFTFGGMLDERLRLHDFQLGRANCQAVLRHLRVGGGERGARHAALERLGGDASIALVPLHGSAAEDVPLPARVRLSRQQKNGIVNGAARVAVARVSRIAGVYLAQLGALAEARVGLAWGAVRTPLRWLLLFAARAVLQPLLWELFSESLRAFCARARRPWWQVASVAYVSLMALATAAGVLGALLLTVPATALVQVLTLLLPPAWLQQHAPAVYNAVFT